MLVASGKSLQASPFMSLECFPVVWDCPRFSEVWLISDVNQGLGAPLTPGTGKYWILESVLSWTCFHTHIQPLTCVRAYFCNWRMFTYRTLHWTVLLGMNLCLITTIVQLFCLKSLQFVVNKKQGDSLSSAVSTGPGNSELAFNSL